MTKTVAKHILNNGLTILAVPSHDIPKVSVQLWIAVGSADEKSGQRGIAHFLEHLLFKGTQRLSETDLIYIVDKLSGRCNAMTSNDFTMYQFDFPRQHWAIGCDLLADIFCNAVFKKDLFNSELCAVIQELKLYKDDYATTLEEEMISLMFVGNPYHYPVIGYKHELWNMQLDTVEHFYRSHYVPRNATLVIVGDVQDSEVLTVAKQYFGHIQDVFVESKKREYPIIKDLSQQSIILYRDIEQLSGKIAFMVPGLSAKKAYDLDILTWIVGRGRGSRLYKKLVDTLACVIDVETSIYDMVEQSVLFITFEPVDGVSFEEVEAHIFEEFEILARDGVTEYELHRAINQARREYLLVFEDTTTLAEEVGYSYLATGDYNYFFQAMLVGIDVLKKNIEDILRNDCKRIYATTGRLLPLPDIDRENAETLQDESDRVDQIHRNERIRTVPLEGLRYSDQVAVQSAVPFYFPRCQKVTLSNGCDVLWHHKLNTSLITIVLDFDSNYCVDSWNKQGEYAFMMRLLMEGTRTYSAQQLAYEFEHAGIDIAVKSGSIIITLFSGLFNKALHLLYDILVNSVFDESRIEWVREQILAEIRESTDDPSEMIKMYAQEQVYKKHPYAKNELGTVETIGAITRDDLLTLYRTFVTPRGSAISIVGDLQNYDVPLILETIFCSWTGSSVEQFKFPLIEPVRRHVFEYPMQRDQITVAYAGLSVARTDVRYDAVALFDYIFTGGSTDSMWSRLFQLREQSGLFYTVSGSLLLGSNEQPGMIFISTVVSPESLVIVEQLIEDEIQKAITTFTEADCNRAKNALINGLIECMASNQDIALSFLFLRRYGLPDDYFDTRADVLTAITVDHVKQAVHSLFSVDKLVLLKIGRL